MSEFLKPAAEWSAAFIEAVGVAILVISSLYALVYGIIKWFGRNSAEYAYHQTRQRLGHGIILGLEFLVAADIIHTVAVELNFRTVSVLAIIVLIRTFLSFTINLEITGRWPWQERKEGGEGAKV